MIMRVQQAKDVFTKHTSLHYVYSKWKLILCTYDILFLEVTDVYMDFDFSYKQK